MAESARHSFSVEDRKRFVADGVRHVGKFSEREIEADTNLGFLVLKGEGLYITELNLEMGKLVVEGRFQSIVYSEEKKTAKRGLWERLAR
ncbi:MAG: YabP/YqfC family sporulation protein [Bacillota bacterium]